MRCQQLAIRSDIIIFILEKLYILICDFFLIQAIPFPVWTLISVHFSILLTYLYEIRNCEICLHIEISVCERRIWTKKRLNWNPSSLSSHVYGSYSDDIQQILDIFSRIEPLDVEINHLWGFSFSKTEVRWRRLQVPRLRVPLGRLPDQLWLRYRDLSGSEIRYFCGNRFLLTRWKWYWCCIDGVSEV